MRASEAFAADYPGVWEQALGGDLQALRRIRAWLIESGLYARQLRLSNSLRQPVHLPLELCRALARLATVRTGLRPVQAAQLAAAAVGDFTRTDDGVCWHIRRCSWARASDANLMGQDLEAWRTVYKYGRTQIPVPSEPFLAPLNGAPWSARAVRYAIARGRGLTEADPAELEDDAATSR